MKTLIKNIKDAIARVFVTILANTNVNEVVVAATIGVAASAAYYLINHTE